MNASSHYSHEIINARTLAQDSGDAFSIDRAIDDDV
jgi:hypothetical protein